jgi:hypothetical protein
VPSAAVGSGLGNYAIGYVNGTLTIDRRALTITASNRTKTYGDTASFAGTEFTAGPLVGTDAVASVTLTSDGAADTATFVAPGPSYAIVPSAAVGSGLGNYTIGYVNGSLTVTQRALVIAASDRSKIVGEVVTFDTTTPSPDFSVNGLANADTVSDVSLTSAGADAAASTSGSPYPIVPGGATGSGLANYRITYVNGRLTVTEQQQQTRICLQYDPLKAHQRGSTIPLKITLCDATGAPLVPPATIVAIEVRRADGTSPMPASAPGNSHPNGIFRLSVSPAASTSTT